MTLSAGLGFNTPEDVWKKLCEPFEVSRISWRQDGKPIHRDGKFLARFVAYVEANDVRERLDSVAAGQWDMTLTPLPPLGGGEDMLHAFKCRLQVYGVVREDVGQGSDYKQAATDAFKRAAVRFGIGHELYSFGQNWVELDGDGKYAKPVEDPGVAYARKHGGIGVEARSKAQSAEATPASTPAESGNAPVAQANRPPGRQLDEESCPKCGGRMWDNRLTKRNPRAPDFKCRDRSCDGVIWPPKPGEAYSNAPAGESEPPEGHPSTAWQPLPDAPMIPDDADLPF